MQEFSFTIRDALGIHARPAGQLVKVVSGFESKVIVKGKKEVDARRIMSLMGLGAKCGDTLTFTVVGDDEAEAAAAIQKFLEDNL